MTPEAQPIPRRFMNLPEAAAHVGLSARSLRRMLAAGRLTAHRPVRGRVLVAIDELHAEIAASVAVPRKRRGIRLAQ
jgi:excisionase family DNA binding protein